MAVAIAVRRSSPLHWLHRLNRPKSSRHSEAPRPTQPPAAYAVNMDRWATLPGEYNEYDAAPIYMTLPPIARPGVSVTVACTMDGPTVLQLGGAWRGRVIFEGSADGRIWQPIALLPLTGDATAEATRPGIWRTISPASIRLLRVHVVRLVAGSVMPAVAGMTSTNADSTDADCIEVAA